MGKPKEDEYIEYAKKHWLGSLSLLSACISVLLLFNGTLISYFFSILFALTSIPLASLENSRISKSLKEALLKNQPTNIKNYVKRIIVSEKLGKYGSLIGKVVIATFVLASFSSFIEENEDKIIRFANKVENAQIPPYVLVHNKTVDIAFEKINGEISRWTVPFDSLEYDLLRGFYSRNVNKQSLKYIDLKDENGEIVKVMDFRPFVDPETFKTVIPNLYRESDSDEEFITEVWNIVTQLNSYSREIEETPLYPMETFISGGGDCEDTAILFASMIKASGLHWKVSLVYMDIDNPEDAQEINHVIVLIDTGEEKYLIETTTNEIMSPYTRVDGWYLEV